ncbi:hypothetical protein EVAR_57336_1 [Eumeta japonica]|uniref:Uncharacterized protein n=1 Tax=Eumeta variegata TaxID=151549 RepID=A0A4C2A0M6_EUMVA|nr:hypothetical protein EVAR_57336_1 [Eumeta japonica]
MDAALNERTLTTEMVKSVGSCDQLDERAETRCAHKEAAHPKCGPGRWSTWSGSMCRLGRFTKQWLRRRPRAGNGFALHRMERACGTASTGSSGKREKPGGCPIKTDSGQVIGPDESATLLAETFFLMTVSILTIRIIRKSENRRGSPPSFRGSARVDPPFTGAEVCSCAGQNSGKDAGRPPPVAPMPKLQATQYGFTPQRGTETPFMI